MVSRGTRQAECAKIARTSTFAIAILAAPRKIVRFSQASKMRESRDNRWRTAVLSVNLKGEWSPVWEFLVIPCLL